MKTTRAFGRTAVLALILSSAAAIGPTKAVACSDNYEVKSGDTLGEIAARCDTTVTALEQANGVDPRALQLGAVLAIPGGEGVAARASARTMATTDPAEDAAGYRVGPGDTIGSIAAELGIPVETLLAANQDVNPRTLRIGDRLVVPGGEEIEAILAEREAERERIRRMAADYPNPKLDVRKGEWRLTIDVLAEDLAPREPVAVAIRGSESDWITLGEMLADDDGRLVARARVPGELADEQSLEVAIERPAGESISATYGGDGTRTAARPEEKRRDVELAGKVVRGGGCSLLVTRDGETYALAGDPLGIRAGEQVLVAGAVEGRAEGCVGHETLRVSTVAPLSGG